MNPFRLVNDFLKEFISEYEQEKLFFGNIICWVLLYFPLWFFLGYLGPYILMFLFALIVIPNFWAFLIWGFCKVPYGEEANPLHLYWLVPLAALCFFIFNGVPGFSNGIFFRFLGTKWFDAIYWPGIEYWWHFFNAINFFASDSIPYNFYEFSFFWGKWTFIIGFVVVVPWRLFSLYETQRVRIKARLEAKKEAELDKKIKIMEATKKEKRKKELERREEEKRKLEEKKRKQEKESLAPDPWDSGFLG